MSDLGYTSADNVAEGEAVADTIPKLLLHQAALRPNQAAIREKEFGIWQTYTWADSLSQVSRIAAGLVSHGFGRGEMAAILGANRPSLYWATSAIQSLGGVAVPLYNDATSDELAYVLKHCEARIVFVEDQEQADKVLALVPELPELTKVVYANPRGLRNYEHPVLVSLEALCEAGKELLRQSPNVVIDEIRKGTAQELSIVCYTSGTTGKPKGVMLSYASLLSVAKSTAEIEDLTAADDSLAYLPMAWIGDHFYSHVQATLVGFKVNCPESPATVMADLREVGPTYFFAPPRVFEAIFTDVYIRMENASCVKRSIYRYFMAHAVQSGVSILEGRAVSWRSRMIYALGNLLVYAPLRNTLGLRRIRTAYTAGEALGYETFNFFRSLGVNLKQVYGQTESSIYVCVHRNGEVFSDTVGPPAPGVEVRLDERGEVFYRGPGVFDGYYKAAEETLATKGVDGWVRSGDAGIFTESGHLRVIDRAKDVGRLVDGAMFAPKYIENCLKFSPFIKEAVTFGDGRPFVTAFINIEMDAVGNWAERNGLPYTSYADLASLPTVQQLIHDSVITVNKSLAKEAGLKSSQIKRFLILHKELDADDGELTRTRKLRRRIIAERYTSLIDALYGDASSIDVVIDVTLEDGRKSSTAARLQILDVLEPNRAKAMQ